MAFVTIEFRVPEEIKVKFQETFAGENRSAIIARLMAEAIEERDRSKRRALAIDALLDLRKRLPKISAAAVTRARHQGRP